MAAVAHVQEAQRIPITGVFEGEPQYIPEAQAPSGDRSYDPRIYRSWAEQHDRSHHGILQAIEKNLTHVDYDTFREELASCTAKFTQKDFNPYTVLVEPEKSQTWATAIAMESTLRPQGALRLGTEGANMLSYSLTQAPRRLLTQDFVIVDDGSFSGNQMTNNISSANRILGKAIQRTPHFHVIVPYMTKNAARKLIDLDVKVHLYTSEKPMPVLSELFPRQRDLDLAVDALWPRAREVKDRKKREAMPLTYFDHKIPNEMSFPEALASGGFIPTFEPPYK